MLEHELLMLVAAPLLTLPGDVDSNSPAIWDLEDGQRRLYVMTSFAGEPRISEGRSLDQMGADRAVADQEKDHVAPVLQQFGSV